MTTTTSQLNDDDHPLDDDESHFYYNDQPTPQPSKWFYVRFHILRGQAVITAGTYLIIPHPEGEAYQKQVKKEINLKIWKLKYYRKRKYSENLKQISIPKSYKLKIFQLLA